jgi:hypothetical protein
MRVPDLGAPSTETRTLCEQQRGSYVDRDSTIGCRVGGQTIFACTLNSDGRTDRCDGFYETADLASSRSAVEKAIGVPPTETLSSEGYRVFEWENGNETVTVTMYAKGVRMTHTRRVADGQGLSR